MRPEEKAAPLSGLLSFPYPRAPRRRRFVARARGLLLRHDDRGADLRDLAIGVGHGKDDRVGARICEGMAAARRAGAIALHHGAGLRQAAVIPGPRRGVGVGGVPVGEFATERHGRSRVDAGRSGDRPHHRRGRRAAEQHQPGIGGGHDLAIVRDRERTGQF